MDLYVSYWDVNASQVKSRYYGSNFLGHATHKDSVKLRRIFHHLLSYMDGPNVNLKFLKEFSKLRAGDSVLSLADIGTCSLHSVHGSMKLGRVHLNGD